MAHLKKINVLFRYVPLSNRILKAIFLLTIFFLFHPLSLKSAGLDLNTPVIQQSTKRITGKILDEFGDPLPGATILVVGSTRGVITDLDGSFVLDGVPENAKIEISFMGLETEVLEVKGRSTFDVKMKEKVDMLEEVSIVAFAKQKKESVLASITTVKPGELKVPSSNLTTALAGRVAGLISYQTSGEPGQDNASFFIRGITSFGASAKKDPLILIDGIELTTDDLARLNTDDIASFSILKDATATALYGARGANGVILVTTKEGKEGKVSVNVRVENSFTSPTRKVDIADPVTFMRMQNEAIKTRDPLGIQLYSPEKIEMTERGLYPDLYPATDWYKALFRDMTTNQRANISLSGGGPIARYYVAANITKDNGNIKVDNRNNFNNNISLLKYSVRSNVNVNLTKSTELILRMNASFDEYTGPIDGGTDLYRKVLQANPVLFKPYYEPDVTFGYANHILFGNYGDASYINPYAESLKGYRDYSKNTMLASLELKQKLDFITEGLDFRALFNATRNSEYNVHRMYNPFYYNIKTYDKLTNIYTLNRLNPDEGTEYLEYYPQLLDNQVSTAFYMEAIAEYNRMINRDHSINGLLVYTMRQEKKGIAEDLQRSLPFRNISLAGRAAYNYDTRYFAEANFGLNGSERFSKRNRWGFFPSVSVGWMVSNEAFFEPASSFITQLKIRGGYGLSGNDAIGDEWDRFYYLSWVEMMVNRNTNFGERLEYNPYGIAIVRYANDNIGWETYYKTNLALEFSIKEKFSAIVELYHQKVTNILIDRIIPATMGITQDVKANLGVGQGRGVDIEANYEHSINKDLWLTGRGTFTYAKSKVLEWEEPDYSDTPWRSKVGYSNKQMWGLIAERLFIDEYEVANSPQQFGDYMAGDIKYRDVNGDGKITALDMVPLGFPEEPEINYGFGISAGYKNLDVSVFFQGSARQSFFYEQRFITPFVHSGDRELLGYNAENAVLQAFADSYWSESNRNPYALWPRLSNNYVENNAINSTWFLNDASFIRLKSAEIGYTLPRSILKKIFLSNARIYANGTNLLTFSKFKLWDPELKGEGFKYPIQRVINVGLNVSF